MKIENEMPKEEKGLSPENPFDTLQEAFDACDGSGKTSKTFFVYNPNAILQFWEIEDEEEL